MALSRSEQMARIRGEHTTPERILRSSLWKRGLRYRLYARTPVGRPDVVFPGPSVAVFVDGCFWHGCPAHYVRPRTREEFWSSKLKANVERDRRQTKKLLEAGWCVVRVWEHQVHEDISRTTDVIESIVRGQRSLQPDDWRVIKVNPLPGHRDRETRYLVKLCDDSARRNETQQRSTRKWKSR